MIKWINKAWRELQLFGINLFSATKNAEAQLLTQSGVDMATGSINVSQDINQGAHALSKALLKGELTEEVQQLRYRTYKVDREAKKYKYYAPTLAIKKKEGKDNKFISYDKSDGLDVITIQENYELSEDILDAINQIENGGRGKGTRYKIEVERKNFITRYKIEEFLKKIVVKRLDDTHVILDFYFSKYPEKLSHTSDDKSFRSKVFIHEIEKIRDGVINPKNSDMLTMDGLRFVTNHAYNQDDLKEFTFKNIWYKEVAEFDGDYILRFKAQIIHNGIDLTSVYYNAEMEEKYKNKEKKELTIDISGNAPIETYVCADCGKTVTFDTQKIDGRPICEARDIMEEHIDNEDDKWDVTSYLDYQVVEQTIGKKLCKNCLKKYLDNREK